MIQFVLGVTGGDEIIILQIRAIPVSRKVVSWQLACGILELFIQLAYMHDHGSTSSLTKHVPKLKHEACGWMISHSPAKNESREKRKKKQKEIKN